MVMLMRSLLIMSLSVYNECANHGRKDDMGRVGGGGEEGDVREWVSTPCI